MSLLHMCIEVRKNLGCANVFLQFDESLSDNEFLKINLKANSLRLCEFSTETIADLSAYFDIDASTMCNLTVEEHNASFRLHIKNVKEAAFKTEYTTTGVNVEAPQLPTPASLHCSNCLHELCAPRRYTRILAFPTCSIDSSEFFCHETVDFKQKLVPNDDDLFYGFNFIVVNSDVMAKTVKTKSSHVYCKRCLQFLGETLLNGKAMKLWSEALRVKSKHAADKSELFELFSNQTKATVCTRLMQFLLYELNLGIPMQHFAKVLLNTTFPNRQRRYILLQILEQQLQILRNREPLMHGNTNNNNMLEVKLYAQKCSKLYYMTLDTETSVVTKWQADSTIFEQNISPGMFNDLLKQLTSNALITPLMYREMAPNGFRPSYVFYDFG